MALHEFKVLQLVQTKNQVILINQFNNRARTIWTDGRELPNPKDVDPRWYGYSTGKWVDDYTFVVETVGMDERTWLDHAGRPHSNELKVEEQFHRVNNDRLELTAPEAVAPAAAQRRPRPKIAPRWVLTPPVAASMAVSASSPIVRN